MEKQVHEKELLIPSLKIIYENPNITTSELIKRLEKEIVLYEKDRKILNNRRDTYFSQTVRNLCGSHSLTNEFGKCVTITKNGSVNSFIINKKGLELLNIDAANNIEDVSEDEIYQKEISGGDTTYEENELKELKKRIPEQKSKTSSKSYKKDAKLARTVLKIKNYECENAKLLGVEHKTFISKKGVQYQEAHHLIPMKAQRDFNQNLDVFENIVCLCPLCHKAIHNANKEGKLEILTRLYNYKKKALREAGINISLEDLYNNYYV